MRGGAICGSQRGLSIRQRGVFGFGFRGGVERRTGALSEKNQALPEKNRALPACLVKKGNKKAPRRRQKGRREKKNEKRICEADERAAI